MRPAGETGELRGCAANGGGGEVKADFGMERRRVATQREQGEIQCDSLRSLQLSFFS